MGLGLSKDDADGYYQKKGSYVNSDEFAAYAYLPQGDWKYKCKNLAYNQDKQTLGYRCKMGDGEWKTGDSSVLSLKDCDPAKITLGADGVLKCTPTPPPAAPESDNSLERFHYRRAVQVDLGRKNGERFRYLRSSNRKESLFA